MGAMIASAVIAAGTAVYSSRQAKKQQKAQNKLAKEGIEAADPFGPYRKQYAEKLNALMEDPESIVDTPEYKARMQATERQVAAQGYTGSGNAILEAANAGGAAFEQAYQRLANLSGAGATPGGGYAAALSANAQGNAQYLSSVAGVGNTLGYLANSIWNRPANPPAQTAPPPTLGNGGPQI